MWEHVKVMVTGVLLARGQRTVTTALRVMGLSNERHFANYHRVLNRAKWSAHELSRVMLVLLVKTFCPSGEILMGGDDTIERRRGDKIAAKGIYRDPVRSSRGHFVKASGLRWATMMLVTCVPFARRIWALPFMTLLAPSKRFYESKLRAPKKLTDWMRQGLFQVRRWFPDRKLIFVGDAGFAVLELLVRMMTLKNPITMVTRFRLDAALYDPAPIRTPGQRGRTRKKGARKPAMAQIAIDPATRWTTLQIRNWYGEMQRSIEIVSDTAVWYHSAMPVVPLRWVIIRDPLGSFKTQALLCTDLLADPQQIVEWFIQRWQLEVTHREVREHLGVETQRQWSDLAIARTTPILFGLYSLITLLAHALAKRGKVTPRPSAWYVKPNPTFSDAFAAVRLHLWRHSSFCMSRFNAHILKLPRPLFNRLADALCYST